MEYPPDIRTCFYETLNGERTPLEFEAWLYAQQGLEWLISDENYLNLLCIGYHLPAAKYELSAALSAIIAAADFYRWKLERMLRECLQRDIRMALHLRELYDLYCRGYHFLERLGLHYGLDIQVPDPYEPRQWEELTDREQQRTLEGFFPELEQDLQEVLRWLQRETIVLTGAPSSEDCYLDYRGRDRDRPAENPNTA